MQAALKLESKMFLHGHETLRPALREERNICRIYLPILSSGLLVCQLDIDKLTLNYQNNFKTREDPDNVLPEEPTSNIEGTV